MSKCSITIDLKEKKKKRKNDYEIIIIIIIKLHIIFYRTNTKSHKYTPRHSHTLTHTHGCNYSLTAAIINVELIVWIMTSTINIFKQYAPPNAHQWDRYSMVCEYHKQLIHVLNHKINT